MDSKNGRRLDMSDDDRSSKRGKPNAARETEAGGVSTGEALLQMTENDPSVFGHRTASDAMIGLTNAASNAIYYARLEQKHRLDRTENMPGCAFRDLFWDDDRLRDGYDEDNIKLLTIITEVETVHQLRMVRDRCPGIRCLCFHDDFNFQIETNLLPPKLTHLTFGRNYNFPIERMPKTIQLLIFGRQFNQPISEYALPENLKQLVFGRSFDQSIIVVLRRLKNLTNLYLGRQFNEYVDVTELPNLKRLSVSDQYKYRYVIKDHIVVINASRPKHNHIELIGRQTARPAPRPIERQPLTIQENQADATIVEKRQTARPAPRPIERQPLTIQENQADATIVEKRQIPRPAPRIIVESIVETGDMEHHFDNNHCGEFFIGSEDDDIVYNAISTMEIIGEGGYAQVVKTKYNYFTTFLPNHAITSHLRTFSLDDDHLLAIKMVESHETDEKQIRQYNTERTILHQLNTGTHARYFSQLYACFLSGLKTAPIAYWIMEYIPTTLLAHINTPHNRISLSIMVQLCRATQALHDLHWVHRDLHPNNIMITTENRLKIIDFGVSCYFTFERPRRMVAACSGVAGAEDYNAPELLKGDTYGPKIDWWSLGVIFIECILGKRLTQFLTDEEDLYGLCPRMAGDNCILKTRVLEGANPEDYDHDVYRVVHSPSVKHMVDIAFNLLVINPESRWDLKKIQECYSITRGTTAVEIVKTPDTTDSWRKAMLPCNLYNPVR